MNTFMRARWTALAIVAVASILPTAAVASVTFTATGTNPATGSFLKAEAIFDDSLAGTLKITLSNIGGDVLAPSDVLTGLFFTLGGAPTLTPSSAVVGPSSAILWDTDGTPATYGPGTVVGGEWEYATGLSDAPWGASSGISSFGGELFGSANFPGADLDHPPAVNGMNYGLLSAADDPTTGNDQVREPYDKNPGPKVQMSEPEPFVKNSVVFVLGVSGSIGKISRVSFQYGTALDEPNIRPPDDEPPPVIPEPTSIAVWSLLGLAFGYRQYRSGRRQ